MPKLLIEVGKDGGRKKAEREEGEMDNNATGGREGERVQ